MGISDEDFQCSLDARKEISLEKRGHVSPALRTESQHIGDGDVKRREMPNLTLQLSLERTVENKNVDKRRANNREATPAKWKHPSGIRGNGNRRSTA